MSGVWSFLARRCCSAGTRGALGRCQLQSPSYPTTRLISMSHPLSSKIKDLSSRDHWVTSADQGRTIVCYHPERAFPYEHSLPVPREEALSNDEESLLKVQFRQDWIDETAKNNKELDFNQLAKIFHQDKIAFLPKPQSARKSRHRKSPEERDGL